MTQQTNRYIFSILELIITGHLTSAVISNSKLNILTGESKL